MASLANVLLIDDDATTVSLVQYTLHQAGHEVLVSSGGTSASLALAESSIDVLVLDASLESAQGQPFLELALAAPQPIPTLMLLSQATARDAESALDRGAAGILDKPFTGDELLRGLTRALRTDSFRGHLRGFSLLDIFQVFHLSRRSLIVCLGTQPEARVWFENGEVVHAERGGQEGETVLDTLLDVSSGTIRTLPFEPTRRSVQRPFDNLLLELLRTRDETNEGLEPSADLDPSLDTEASDFLGLQRPSPASDLEESPPPPSPSISHDAPTALPRRRHDPICVAITAEIPGCLAAGLVDLATGQLIGLSNTASFRPEFERFIALYTRGLFRGPEVRHIEETLAEQRGIADSRGFVEEVVLTSRHTHHLAKVIAQGDVALMLVTPRRVAVESTWARARAMLPIIERNLK